ncbi:MAG: hypothetical protein D6750_06700, partial [Bacteroidetes bacterium]
MVRSFESPRFGNGIRLYDLLGEREGRLLYLAGEAQATNWGTLLGNLPLAPTANQTAGFLLGLRASGSGYAVLGYRNFWAFRYDARLFGAAYEAGRAQFYLLGGWEDSLVVGPRQPAGATDTVTLSGTPLLRLWLGRLDWYRLETSAYLSRCVPDTLDPAFSLTWTGTSTGEDTAFVWMPADPTRRYFPHQTLAFREGWRFSVPAGQEGRRTASAPLYALGRYPLGSYFLTQRVKALPRLWADVIDTLWLQVTGTTVPELGRAGFYRDSRLAIPFLGYATASQGASSAPSPFYRRDSVKFSVITDLAYFPWRDGQEGIYAYESSSRCLYWVDLGTGQVKRSDPLPLAYRILPDRGRGRLFFRTGLDFYPFPGGLPLLQKNLGNSSYLISQAYAGYPLRYDSTWVSPIIRAAFLPSGDLVFVAEARPSTSAWEGSLFRVSFAADSVWRVTGRPSSGTCPQDGVGNSAFIGSSALSTLAVEGDTVYWIEQLSCPPVGTWILRRAYPEAGNPRSYQVQTIDTLLRAASSSPGQLEFASAPARSLVFFLPFGMAEKRLVRYYLDTR